MKFLIKNGSVRTVNASVFGDVSWYIVIFSYFGTTNRPSMHFKLSNWQHGGAPYAEAIAKSCTVTNDELRWPASGEVEVRREGDDIYVTVFDEEVTELFTVIFSVTDDHLSAEGVNRHAIGDHPYDFNAFYLAMSPVLVFEAS